MMNGTARLFRPKYEIFEKIGENKCCENATLGTSGTKNVAKTQRLAHRETKDILNTDVRLV